MTSFLKKSISLVTITFLVLQPFLIIDPYSNSASIIPTVAAQDNSDCQGNPNCYGDDWVDLSANEGNTADSNPDIARAQADREKKDAEAAKKEAENAQKLQEEDRKKCESMLSGGKDQDGALGKAFKNMFTKAATGLLSSQMPPQFKGIFDSTINAAINDPANLGAAMQESLGNSIIAGTNAAFSKNFERAVSQQTNGGQIPLTEADLQQLIQETLAISTKSALPGAAQQAMDKGLAGAVRNTLRNKTPELTSGWVQAGTAENFKKNGADELRAQLSGPLFSLLSDNARQSQNDTINLNGADGGDLQNMANIIIEFIVKSTGDLLEASATVPRTTTTYDDEGNAINTTTTEITYESINKKVGDEVFDKFGVLFQKNPDGSLANPEIEQKIAYLPIESLIADSGFNNARQKILANANKDPNNNLNGNLDKLYTTIPFDTIARGVNTTGLISNGGQVNIQKTVEQVMIQFSQNVSSSGGGGGNPLVQTAISSVGGNLSKSVGGFLSNEGNQYGSLTESFQGGLSNGLGDMTGNLANGLLDKALGDTPFAGVVDVSFITDSLGNSVTNLVGGIFENGTLDIGGAFSAGFANFGSGLADAALGAVLDLAGVPKPIKDVINAVKDTAVGLIIPFVPNREQIGPELTASKKTAAATGGTQENTSQINQTTRSQEQLDVEACTKLRAIDRKQNAEEQKQKVEDPELVRKAATEVEKYRQELLDWAKKGRNTTGQEEDGPLYMENRGDLVRAAKKEAGAVFFDDLKKSTSPFKDDTLQKLQAQKNNLVPPSTITKKQYEDFKSGRVTDPDEWWSTLTSIYDPFRPNSPESSLRLNQIALDIKKEEAEQEITEEVLLGQGFLGVRECTELTSDGKACRRWETQTPAIQIKESVAKALATRLDQYLDPKQGAITEGNEPSVEEIRNFTPKTSGGGGSGPGTKSSSSILQTILNLLNTLRVQQEDQGGLSFNYTVVTDNNSPTSVRLSWQGTNILACSTADDWIGPGSDLNFVNTIKKQGESLDPSGSFTFRTPLTFDLRFSRTRAGGTPPEQSVVVGTTSPTLYSRKTLTLPTDLKTGDVLTIRLWPFIDSFSVAVPIGNDISQATILSNIAQAIVNARTSEENPTQKAEFLKYSFATDSAQKKIIVSPKITYSISCVDKQGNNLKKSVTIGE